MKGFERPQEVTAGMGWGSVELWLGLKLCVLPALFLGLVSPLRSPDPRSSLSALR